MALRTKFLALISIASVLSNTALTASGQSSSSNEATSSNLCEIAEFGASNCACVFEAFKELDGFTELDPLEFLDLPDPDTVRTTSTIEQVLVSKMIANPSAGVTKTYCTIGIQNMVVDFSQRVEDDAIYAILTRAVFVWDSSGDPIGWRLDKLGERFLCARGDDPLAQVCP